MSAASEGGVRTGALPFARTPHPSPAADEEVARALASPGFGSIFTDHMVVIRWSSNRGWHEPTRLPYAPMTLDPATAVMHYGQAIFEGLKAYRQPDGSVAAFRPYANAARFRASAVRMAMPELPDELFVASLTELVGADEKWVPAHGEDSLYLRPFMIATSVGLGVNAPAAAFDYRLIASPAGSYFAGGARPVTVWISHEYVRAAPGGTGAAKCAGNYAAAFRAQGDAARHGCEQVVWLDALERRWVEELGGMNLFFVFGSGDDVRLVTPELIGTIVAGITRHSLLTLARDLGYAVEERRVSVEEWRSAAMSGALSEVFASGTAAAITPIGRVRSSDGEFLIGDGRHGEVTMRLRTALTGIQTGSGPDVHHWMYRLAPGADR